MTATPTTLELIERFGPCREGRAFAEANPDPRRAIEVALAASGSDDLPTCSQCHPWSFIRWAMSWLADVVPELHLAVGEEIRKADAACNNDGREHIRIFTEGCARRLLAWLDTAYPIEGAP